MKHEVTFSICFYASQVDFDFYALLFVHMNSINQSINQSITDAAPYATVMSGSMCVLTLESGSAS